MSKSYCVYVNACCKFVKITKITYQKVRCLTAGLFSSMAAYFAALYGQC